MSATLECEPEVIQSSTDCGPDQEWLTRGRELAAEDDASQQALAARQFAIGDWLTEGVEKWKRDAYDDAAAIFTNYTRETLRNFASVARAVKTSLRNDDLSWSHHAAVARFEETPEIQKELLAEAVSLKLPLQKFRSHISNTHPTAKLDRSLRLTLKPTAEEMEELTKLALELGDERETVALSLLRWALRQSGITEKLREAA